MCQGRILVTLVLRAINSLIGVEKETFKKILRDSLHT